MDKTDINEIMKAAIGALDMSNFKGDVVMYKHVETEMHIAEGGIGVQNVYYGNNGKPKNTAHEMRAEPTIDDKVNSPYPFIIIPSLEDAIISKIHSYLEGKTPSQARDVMKPLRAAQDAGVIRRITYEEMKTAFPKYCPISKSSVSKYTKEDEMPYIDQAFKDMVVDFKAMKGNRN